MRKLINIDEIKNRIDACMGREKCDMVFVNGKYLNVFTEEIIEAKVAVKNGYIVGIKENYDADIVIDLKGKTIIPGLIDSHIHLESAVVNPLSFRDLAVPHGTCMVIIDPHEITNVLGTKGIDFVINFTKNLDMKVYIMMPSCVPSTDLDESKEIIDDKKIKPYYMIDRVRGLAEFMNNFGIVNNDDDCIKKCVSVLNEGKLIDGHAPKLSGRELNAYLSAAISTDHECGSVEEALEKISKGMWIEVREGTVCHDLQNLYPLFDMSISNRLMLSTDDRHADELKNEGHIDYIIRKAIKFGANPIKVIKAATINTAMHYGFEDMGAIAPSYLANMVVVDNITDFNIDSVYINGELVAKNKEVIKKVSENVSETFYNEFDYAYHSFNMQELTKDMITIKENGNKERCISIDAGKIVTSEKIFDLKNNNGYSLGESVDDDIAKVVTCERHNNTGHVGIGFLHNYGIKKGAIASSVAHDSHNLTIVGVNDDDIILAGNCVRKNGGGFAIACDGKILCELRLEVAGIMTNANEIEVSEKLKLIKETAYNVLKVNPLIDPLMTLAFMNLPVIPDIKITTLGMVDVLSHKIVKAIF